MDKELQEFIEKQKEVVASSYEHAKQYSNIIILGGYAGLFAIWNFTREDLEKWQVLSVGLCTLVSLFIYIVFELYGSWLRSTQVSNQMKELNQAEQLNKFPEAYGKSELARAQKYMALWPYFFFGAIAFALVAALILIYSFISGLVCG
ncbi:MAG: hypothetical protein AB2747_10730 [Candidatus Thiodiazotropha taylori]